MALQDTDRFLVQRSGTSYRMNASDLSSFIDSSSVVVSTSAPESPEEGDMWFDSINDILFVYVDSLWISTAFIEDGSVTPAKLDRAYVEVSGGNMTGDLTLGTTNITLSTDGTIAALTFDIEALPTLP